MNIAIIPARGGSKRIKNKNFKNFFGRPIITYSIDLAKKSKLFSEIIVSTDNKKIMEISKKQGATILFKRPKHLSKDNVPIIDVIAHSIKKLRKLKLKPSNVCCIFPISPLITENTLKKSLQILKNKKLNYVFPVTKNTYSNQNQLFVSKNKTLLKNKQENKFFDAGQFYWGRTKAWEKKLRIFSSKSGIIELNSKKIIDVNYISDWNKLKKVFKKDDKRKKL